MLSIRFGVRSSVVLGGADCSGGNIEGIRSVNEPCARQCGGTITRYFNGGVMETDGRSGGWVVIG